VRDPLSLLAARPRARVAFGAGLLVLMAALLVLSSLHKRLAVDEYDNLSYGHRFLTKGPGVPPLGQRMPVLVLNALGCAPDGCDPNVLNQSETRRLAVRFPSMLFALALAALAWRWGHVLGGPAAGLAALWIAAFDPTLLGHGKQVTSDVAVAFFMAAATYAAWRLLVQPSRMAFAGCALATGAAILSKFTGLLMLPILVAIAAVHLFRRWRAGARPMSRDLLRALGGTAAFALAVLFLVNAGYLFHRTFVRASLYNWQSRAFQEHARWPIPVPLPRPFALGLDYSSLLQENPEIGRGFNYVLGELNKDGRWYAFPLMLLLKTPLAVFVLAGLGARRWSAADAVAPVCLFLVVMGVFSFAADPQLGIRYVLPALPALYVAAARAVERTVARAPWLAPLLLVWTAASTLSYHPHYIAYFNELIGRRVNAYRYLADSNLDWEDHTWWIDAFRRRHPEMDITVDPETPQAGYLLVRANRLVGILEPETCRWLREGYEPLGHVAYAHLLYYVPPERLGNPPQTPPHH
jgi:hypothetical protein